MTRGIRVGRGWHHIEEGAELGALLNTVQDAVFEELVPEPPAEADRVCLLCPCVLSRYNTGHVCGPCERTNREFLEPLVIGGKAFDGDWLKAHQTMRNRLVGMRQRLK